jgi:hypothetical protein
MIPLSSLEHPITIHTLLSAIAANTKKRFTQGSPILGRGSIFYIILGREKSSTLSSKVDQSMQFSLTTSNVLSCISQSYLKS